MMIEKIYSEEFEQKVLHSDKPVIVDFFADWCGPCKMLSPVLEALASKNNDIDFYKINVDENTDLAEKYSVSSIPMFLYSRTVRLPTALSDLKQRNRCRNSLTATGDAH